MDAPRRSSRSNKGKNSRLESEQLEYREQLKKEEDLSSYIIKPESVLCTLCGTTDENYDSDEDSRDMIQCNECLSWQHNECLLQHPDSPPEDFTCNICDPFKPYYKTLKFEIDPEPYTLARAKALGKKSTRAQEKDVDDQEDDDFKLSGKRDVEEEDDEEFTDNDADDADLKISTVPKRKIRKVSTPVDEKPVPSRKSPVTKVEKRVSPKINGDHIVKQAREAVTKRFSGMFNGLLSGVSIPNESDSAETVSQKWAEELEHELFECYHDEETGKVGKDYKESSTRIFVNVKDVKNLKLRNSIINKNISFYKLVRMPVNELLNPDLRKEKEEAIKESTTLATLEKAKVSNIRRTHKGDIVLEKEDSSNNPQFDFNLGVNVDKDEKRFSKAENIVQNEHKNSIYSVVSSNNEDYDNGDDTINNGEAVKGLLDDDQEDEDLAAILGVNETKEPYATSNDDVYDPAATANDNLKFTWEGQIIFAGITNFESSLIFTAKTLTDKEFSICSPHLVDLNLPLMIEGRLDAGKADQYIDQVSGSRKLVLLELKAADHCDKNFEKLFEYFESRKKFGVITNKNSFVKDAYIFTVHKRLPRFLQKFHQLPKFDSNKRVFVVFVIKQEFLKDLMEINQVNNYDTSNASATSRSSEYNDHDSTRISESSINSFAPGFEFLATLSPPELDLVNGIFDKFPQTRQDPNLLIQFLQTALIGGQQAEQ